MGYRIGGQQQISAILKMFPCQRQQKLGLCPLPQISQDGEGSGLELRNPGVWFRGLLLTLVKPFLCLSFTQHIFIELLLSKSLSPLSLSFPGKAASRLDSGF